MTLAHPYPFPTAAGEASAQIVPELEEGDAEPKFRAIVCADGVRRGIRLETIYWDGLASLVSGSRHSLADIVEQASTRVGEGSNLASMLRVLAFRWMWRRYADLQAAYSTDNLNTLVQACPSPVIVLTRDKKIQLFNEPFVSLLKQRLALGNVLQLSTGFRFVLETQVEEALEMLSSKGKMITTGFTASCGGRELSGQINLAMAPNHRKPMVIGYIVRH